MKNVNPTGDSFVQDLCKSLNSIFAKKQARPMQGIKPPSKPLGNVTARPKPNQATSEPMSERYPLAFNGSK